MARITAVPAEELHPGIWSTPIRIRFGHCDPAGIVYTPAYFDLFNVAVEQWYEACLGLDYYGFIRDRRIGIGYAHASADFLLPGFMGETLTIAIVVSEIGGASFTLTLHAFKDAGEAVRGRFVVVTTSLAECKPIPIPPDLRQALEDYRDRTR